MRNNRSNPCNMLLVRKVMPGTKSFTMIELMIVIGIMGILSSVLIPTFSSSLKKSRDAKRKGDIASIQSAIESYYEDTKTYPLSLPTGDKFCHPNGCNVKTYMQKVPTDPGAANRYVYESDGATYTLYSCVENTNDQGRGVQQTGYEKNCGACGTCKFSPTGGSSIVVSQPTATPAPQQPTATPAPQQPTVTPIPQAQNTTAYRDEDNDGYTVGGAQQVALQNGSLPSGWKNNPSTQIDCYDLNTNAYPGSSYYGTSNRGDGSFDYDCDGQQTQDKYSCTISTGCSVSGTCSRCAGYSYADSNHSEGGMTHCGGFLSDGCYIEISLYDCKTTSGQWRPGGWQGPQLNWCWSTDTGHGGIKSATWSPTGAPRTCGCK